MTRIISFIKKESVLFVSLILAAASMFFVVPDTEYVSYIDFRTLCLLFCLMAVMAGFSKAGLFEFCANSLLCRAKNTTSVVLILTLLCFFFSAVITNDVALITFVPFAITVLKLAGKVSLIPITVILQTVAANMGSCLTPIGNPQNIYIFNISGLSFLDFVRLLLPYSVAALAVLVGIVLGMKKEVVVSNVQATNTPNIKSTVIFALLFLASLLAVFGVVHHLVCLVLVVLVLLIADRKLILKIDYSLLLTFVGFFIFVGNMGRIPAINNMIVNLLWGREIVFSALISQVISNVPAALLLSGFTDNMSALLVGVNIGGLGTLIASMASLISYKYVAAALPDKKVRYLLIFSLLNFALLGIMLLLSLII